MVDKVSVELADVLVVRTTEDMALCLVGVKSAWIPCVYIKTGSEPCGAGYRGCMSIPRWVAEDEKLI